MFAYLHRVRSGFKCYTEQNKARVSLQMKPSTIFEDFKPQTVKLNMQKPVTGLYASPTLVRTLSKMSLVSVLKGPRLVLSVADMDAVNATLGLSVCGEDRLVCFI